MLKRVVGVPGAVLMGLGSILGAGVFVSIGIAAGVAGPSVILAVPLAALVATFNGLSSAQLAASHPVSGGTYEYGYRYLSPTLGFTAGWVFICAKSASAATAALGFAGYLLAASGVDAESYRVPLALAGVALLTAVVASGLRRSSRMNAIIVALTLVSLLGFVIAGLPSAISGAEKHTFGLFRLTGASPRTSDFLHSVALMFVAYTGYGRIATLGEEVRDPRRTIPLAMIITLLASAVIYTLVGFVAVSAQGAEALAHATQAAAAPLEIIARGFEIPGLSGLVTAGAVTAMLGVLLNLVLGLSRVVLAMARRRDLPPALAHIDKKRDSPTRAVCLVGIIIAGLASIGNVKATWSFSAFSVLVYYAITNLATLRLPKGALLYPRWISLAGLASCLGLSLWVEPYIWLFGLAVVALGLLGRSLARTL